MQRKIDLKEINLNSFHHDGNTSSMTRKQILGRPHTEHTQTHTHTHTHTHPIHIHTLHFFHKIYAENI
jgi:hypothetical protein